MKIEREVCEQRFREMSDEALLSLSTEDLVPIARGCYDEELRRRGLTPGRKVEKSPAVDAPKEEEANPNEELILLTTFRFPGEAAVMQSALKSAGIPSYLIGGRGLRVPASAIEEAREILANGRNEVAPEV